MAAKTQSLRFRRIIQAPPAEVYRAFTHATALRDWLADAATAQPRPGGYLYLWWNTGHAVHGRYTALMPGKKVAFTWQGPDEPAPTRVNVTLTPKNGGTWLFGRNRRGACCVVREGGPRHVARVVPLGLNA